MHAVYLRRNIQHFHIGITLQLHKVYDNYFNFFFPAAVTLFNPSWTWDDARKSMSHEVETTAFRMTQTDMAN